MGSPYATANSAAFDELRGTGRLVIEPGSMFGRAPEPMPDGFDFTDRVGGMLLGVAVGDSLGKTTEGLTPTERGARYGEVIDYLPYPKGYHDARGYPTDDTQLTFWLLEQICRDGEFRPGAFAELMRSRRIEGIGDTVRRFLENLDRGLAWEDAGPEICGNGALMAVSPVLVPHLRRPSADLWVDTYLRSHLTHRDAGACSACVAYTALLWELLRMDQRPPQGWYVETYVHIARELEGRTLYQPRHDAAPPWNGPLWQFTEESVPAALESGWQTRDVCDRFGSGAYLMETLPCVLFILERHGGNLEEAIIRAVNDTKDNDTVAATVGAAMGALHGRAAIPDRWLAGLTGRTRHHSEPADDGRVLGLIEEASRALWHWCVVPGTHYGLPTRPGDSPGDSQEVAGRSRRNPRSRLESTGVV